MTYDIKEHAIEMIMQTYHITREEALELESEIDAAMQVLLFTSMPHFEGSENHPLNKAKMKNQ
jgi:hypothetical protein